MYVGVIVVHHLPLIVTQSALSALLRMPYFLSFSVLRAGTRQASLKDKLEFLKFDNGPIILIDGIVFFRAFQRAIKRLFYE
jgi:hypothetical protein